MNVVRRSAMVAGTPVRALLVFLIRGYRVTLAGMLGGQCRFEPSCSAYAEEAIRRRGAVRGSALAMWRVLRCNPFGRPGSDPVPASPPYDDVLRRAQRKARV